MYIDPVWTRRSSSSSTQCTSCSSGLGEEKRPLLRVQCGQETKWMPMCLLCNGMWSMGPLVSARAQEWKVQCYFQQHVWILSWIVVLLGPFAQSLLLPVFSSFQFRSFLPRHICTCPVSRVPHDRIGMHCLENNFCFIIAVIIGFDLCGG